MEALLTRPFGDTGLAVPALGFGAGSIGGPELSEDHVGYLLNRAVDLGVRLIDTAPSYGASEARIGRHLAHRRDETILSTKLGYGVPGVEDWTGPCITAGVDQALQRLGTDRLDIAHLHSCPRAVLERGDVVEALRASVRAGKVRVAAYSGDGHDLGFAVESGAFGAVQASLNVCDQANGPTLDSARRRGLGVIAKRPLANAPWRFEHRPTGQEPEAYWDRWRSLALDLGTLSPESLAVRFAAHHPSAHTALVGTRSVSHLETAVAAVADGPLPPEILDALGRRYAEVGAAWPPRI